MPLTMTTDEEPEEQQQQQQQQQLLLLLLLRLLRFARCSLLCSLGCDLERIFLNQTRRCGVSAPPLPCFLSVTSMPQILVLTHQHKTNNN